MDKAGNRWSWLPGFMPGVVKLMADKRKEVGAAWVNECWKRGMAGEPGWFYAREGPLAIGTPSCADDVSLQWSPTQALLVLRNAPAPSVPHGTMHWIKPPEGEHHGAH